MSYNYYWSTGDEEPAYTAPNLSVEYRGFKIVKDRDYGIFSIHPPLGKTLHRMLHGGFTKMQLAKMQIDEFLKTHPLEEALEDKEASSHVGRPTKEEAKERRRLELEKRLADLLKELDNEV